MIFYFHFQVKELLFSNPLNDETRDKLAFLSTTTIPSVGRDPRLDTISEGLNSTGKLTYCIILMDVSTFFCIFIKLIRNEAIGQKSINKLFI